MKFYSNPYSPNSRKVHGVLAQTRLEFDEQIVDLRGGEQQNPDFLRVNPNGKVPVLVDDETVLWESNSIVCYLAGKADSDLWPKSAQRYGIMRWMFWEANHWTSAIGTLIGQRIFNRDNSDPAVIEQGLEDFHKWAAVLDSNLSLHKYVSGDALTVADFSVGVWLGYTEVCELPVAEFANIDNWHNGLREMPSWEKMAPPSP